ncbi:MAG: hypothetical protein AB4911_25050 [Oscillochloridaceae bacterium umkhey_bin13]
MKMRQSNEALISLLRDIPAQPSATRNPMAILRPLFAGTMTFEQALSAEVRTAMECCEEFVVTPRRLLGIVQAFLSLAQQHVKLVLADDLETNPANPLAVLDPSVNDEDALAIIAEYAGRDVSEIWPLVYGLDDEAAARG